MTLLNLNTLSPYFFWNGLDTLFAYCAWGGALIYFLRILIGFTGVADSESSDVLDHHESDHAFQFLSLSTLFGFLMMFGFGGLAAHKQFHLSEILSLLIALGSGVLFVLLTRFIFKNAQKLTSSGTIFNIEKTIGLQGRVYQKITPNKRGVIHIILDEHHRELDALPANNQEIESFQVVQILKIIDNKTVIVKKINEEPVTL